MRPGTLAGEFWVLEIRFSKNIHQVFGAVAGD